MWNYYEENPYQPARQAAARYHCWYRHRSGRARIRDEGSGSR